MTELSTPCNVAQRRGSLVFTNSDVDNESAQCTLSVAKPQFVTANNLGVLEADIRLSDVKGSEANGLNQGITFTKSNLPNFEAFCGLGASRESIGLVFAIDFNGKNEIFEQIPAEFDRSYNFRLELEPKTMTFRCFASGQLIGSLVPSHALELRDAMFERQGFFDSLVGRLKKTERRFRWHRFAIGKA